MKTLTIIFVLAATFISTTYKRDLVWDVAGKSYALDGAIYSSSIHFYSDSTFLHTETNKEEWVELEGCGYYSVHKGKISLTYTRIESPFCTIKSVEYLSDRGIDVEDCFGGKDIFHLVKK